MNRTRGNNSRTTRYTWGRVMRGIFFPAANMLFNVQTHDPALKKPDNSPNPKVFDWVQWGSNLYSGWEDVDYAAAALAEATPLLLTPGRTGVSAHDVYAHVTDRDQGRNGQSPKGWSSATRPSSRGRRFARRLGAFVLLLPLVIYILTRLVATQVG